MAITVKRLSEAFGEDKALKIDKLIEDNEDYYSILEEIDKVLDGSGVECVFNQSRPFNNRWFYYVNMGDSYANTIIFQKGRFSLGCWANRI